MIIVLSNTVERVEWIEVEKFFVRTTEEAMIGLCILLIEKKQGY